MDGGVRRGKDILRALALGATAVLLGRPIHWGLCLGGSDGVERKSPLQSFLDQSSAGMSWISFDRLLVNTDALGILQDELTISLQLCGCQSPADVKVRILTVFECLLSCLF